MSKRFLFQAACLHRLLPACLLLLGSSPAQSAQLLKDINTQPMLNPSSKPASFVQLGSKTIFAATRADVGQELWVSDGSSKGTVLLKDIMPGSRSSGPSRLISIGSQVLFIAFDDKNGQELWKTDGTSQGTVMVRNISPGAKSTTFVQMASLGKIVVFLANDNTHPSITMWRSDGTTQGTQLINKAIGFGISGGGMFVAGSKAYFCSDGILWASDGTTNGTLVILRGVAPEKMMADGAFLLFIGNGKSGRALWRSDGTVAGTRILRILPGERALYTGHARTDKLTFFNIVNGGQTDFWRSDGSSVGTIRLATFNGKLYQLDGTAVASRLFFSLGSEAWVSDGSVKGTLRIASFNDHPDNWTTAGNAAFFSASGPKNGRELWHSDGTAKGTREVLDIRPGPIGSSPSQLVLLGNRLYFSASLGLTGLEPWRSDGTPSGTFLLRDIRSGRSSSGPADFMATGNKVLFTADDGKVGREPWITDGTVNGTALLGDLAASPGSKPSKPIAIGEIHGSLVFTADDGIHGHELWITDGSTGRTSLLADIQPGPTSSAPMQLAALDDIVFFGASDGVHGWELWMTDGSIRGTKLVKDIVPGTKSSFPYLGTRHGEEVFFTILAPGRSAFDTLWKTDGTAAGTVEFWKKRTRLLTSVGSKLFFFSAGGLYVTDGSTAATKLLVLTSVTASFGRRSMAVLNGEVYFGGPKVLWKSDGSKKGTVILHNIPSARVDNVVRVGSSILFRANNHPAPSVLYRTDGSASGLQIVSPGLNPGRIAGVLRDKLLFFASDKNVKSGLWISDGSPKGTKFLAPLYRAENLGSEKHGGNRVAYFYASNAQWELELWVSDGSPSGTKLVKKAYTRDYNAAFTLIKMVNGKIVFTADDPRFGWELWVVDPGATTQAIGLACSTRATPPTLVGSDPVLGGNMSLSGSSARSTAGLLLMSTRAVPSLSIASGCRLYLSIPNLFALSSFPVRNSKWTFPLAIPNLKSLMGLQLVVQAFHPTSSSALGFELSNGLLLSLGN